MKEIKLISITDQSSYKSGETIRKIEIEKEMDHEKIDTYYDLKVRAELITLNK